MQREQIKEFLRPTFGKFILTVILFFILFFLLFYSTMHAFCPGQACKNQLLETLGIVVNIVPFLLFFIIPESLEILMYPILILWAYFLSCLISFAYDKLKAQKRQNNNINSTGE